MAPGPSPPDRDRPPPVDCGNTFPVGTPSYHKTLVRLRDSSSSASSSHQKTGGRGESAAAAADNGKKTADRRAFLKRERKRGSKPKQTKLKKVNKNSPPLE